MRHNWQIEKLIVYSFLVLLLFLFWRLIIRFCHLAVKDGVGLLFVYVVFLSFMRVLFILFTSLFGR